MSITLSPEQLAALIADAVAKGVAVALASVSPARSANAERCARYRAKKHVEPCQTMSEPCHDTVSTCTPAPSPSPSFPPSSPFPTPLSSPPTHTPPSAPPPTYAHEGSGFALDPSQTSKPKRQSKSWEPTPEQLEVASWFNRRPTTVWSEKEQKAWKHLKLEDEDLEILKWFYTESGYGFLRRDLLTLLNNWRGEVDRARNYDPSTEGKR